MNNRTTLPPELPPELRAQMTERAAWLAGAGWVAATVLLYLIYDWLASSRSDLVRTLAQFVFGIGGIFWFLAWAPMRDWIYLRLWSQAEAHWLRFGEWPR